MVALLRRRGAKMLMHMKFSMQKLLLPGSKSDHNTMRAARCCNLVQKEAGL